MNNKHYVNNVMNVTIDICPMSTLTDDKIPDLMSPILTQIKRALGHAITVVFQPNSVHGNQDLI